MALDWAKNILEAGRLIITSLGTFISHFREVFGQSTNLTALLTVFRQGHITNICMQLVTYDDSVGLEKLIQYSERIALEVLPAPLLNPLYHLRNLSSDPS